MTTKRAAWTCLFTSVAIFSATSAVASDPDPWGDGWHSTVSLYGWLPGISLDSRFQSPQGTVVENRSDGDIFSKLSGAFMLEATVRHGRWGLYGDVDWVKFDDEKGRVGAIGGQRLGAATRLDTRWNAKGGLVTLAGSFTLGHNSQGYADVLLGARYLWLKGNIGWNFGVTGNGGRLDIADEGHLHRQTHVTDGIIGVRGRWTPFPSKAIFLPYYFDIGAGSSDRTQQYEGGIGYMFHWGDIALIYRDVEYHEHGAGAFLKDVRLSGPSLNLTWAF
jgi:hypothetical protein